MQKMTSLGLDERVERVLAYAFFWVSGLILFLTEKNRRVRWHALQSLVTFGTLSILLFAVSMLKSMLAWVPILSFFTNFGLGLLTSILWWTIILLWIWLMSMAWLRPDYQLPYVSKWIRFLA